MIMKIGIGSAEVHFPKEAFPTPGENYTGVHDAPLVHVLLLEEEERIAIAVLDLTDPGNWDELRAALADVAGTTPENVLLHVSHVLATPHCPHAHDICNEETALKDTLMRRAIREALLEAGAKAREELQEAHFDIGYGETMVNVNRVRETRDGYVDATNEMGVSDHRLPVLCIRNTENFLLGVLYSVNTAAGVQEGSRCADGSRLISGDIASASERWLEKELGIHAVYLLGASGDQWQSMRAVRDWVDAKGELHREDQMDAGFLFTDLLGSRLAQSVLQTIPETDDLLGKTDMKLYQRTFHLPGHQPLPPDAVRKPVRFVQYEPGPDVDTPVWVLCIGELAIVGCQPEVCVETMQQLQSRSPFKHTLLLEFVNGIASYMATAELYEKCTPQAKKGRYQKGAAEQFVEYVSEFLQEIWTRRHS